MATVLVFPSVLGARPGIHDTVAVLTAAGHDARVVDVLDGRIFNDYDAAISHQESLSDGHRHGVTQRALAEVEGPFFTLGFSSGCALAEWAAAQRPEDVRGVVLVGGARPMEWVGAPWPPGVAVETHAMSKDPFSDGAEVAAAFRDDVLAAGGTVKEFTYAGTGHLFNHPGLTDEYDPEATEEFYDRLVVFVSH